MIKGLIALFTSGTIFNPLVLLGVVFGFYCAFSGDAEKVVSLLKDYHLYLLVLFVSTFYIFTFKKIYKDGGDELNLGAMIFMSVWGVAKFVISTVLTISFVTILSF